MDKQNLLCSGKPKFERYTEPGGKIIQSWFLDLKLVEKTLVFQQRQNKDI